MKFLLFFLSIAAFSNVVRAQNDKFVINKDTILSSSFEVPDSMTCSISPGVTIKFNCYGKFIVRGLLIAQGTSQKPITFTCIDRAHGAEKPPCWYGLFVMGKSSHADMRNCRFEGMYRALIYESRPLFDSCEFAGNHCGLYCTKKAAPLVRNCRFYRNIYGIVSDFSAPLLANNIISENTIGIDLQVGSMPLAGPNTIFGNQTNIKTEAALKGDSTALPARYLWELMNELF